jgi:CHAT domain-containing protein
MDEIHRIRGIRKEAIEHGRVLAGGGHWGEAARYYRTAVDAQEKLYHQAMLQSDQFRLLAEEQSLRPEAAYVIARGGDLSDAAFVLEEGRARIFGDCWFRDTLFLENLGEYDKQLAMRYGRVIDQMRDIECRERTVWLEAQPGEDMTSVMNDLRREMNHLRASLEKLLAEASQHIDYSTFCNDQRREFISAATSPGLALVYLMTTQFGSYAVIVDRPTNHEAARYSVCWIDGYTDFDLQKPLFILTSESDILIWTVGSTLRAANALSNLERTDHWRSVIDHVDSSLAEVGQKLILPLVERLIASGITGVTIIPFGPLGQVPLHIAPFLRERMVEYLLDIFAVRFAPSACLLEMSRRSARRNRGREQICTAIQGTDLPGMESQVQHLSSIWPGDEFRWISAAQLTPDTVAKSLHGTHYAVFSCHGHFMYWNQLASGFREKGLTILNLRDMINAPLLSECSLVIASTCQSSFEDSTTTLDEGVGLSLGLLLSGAAGVLGAQWNVDDLVCAIVVTRFHQEFFHERAAGLEPTPWFVLSRVQRWLRNVTAEEMKDYVLSEPALSALLDIYPLNMLFDIFVTKEDRVEEGRHFLTAFEAARAIPSGARIHPWYWGAFTYMGS